MKMDNVERFGIKLRLVEESDAAFILELRTDERNSRYISPTKNSLEHQIDWIRKYKVREEQGQEYYFIASDLSGVQFATFRLYPWRDGEMEVGSWVSKPGHDKPWDIFRMLMVMKFYFSQHLGLEKVMYRVKKQNTSMIKFVSWGGRVPFDEDEEFYYYYFTRENIKELIRENNRKS